MKDRREKILDVAIELAQEGGFDNVRQRDVAAQAGVALGTLYKSFRSKEDILCAALEREAQTLEKKLNGTPPKGDTPRDRLVSLFQMMTKGLCRKPKFTRAVLRAMASGEPEVASNVASYHGRINSLIWSSWHGTMDGKAQVEKQPTEDENNVVFLIQQFWFASLVGWSAGLFSQNDVVDQVRTAIDLLFRGISVSKPMIELERKVLHLHLFVIVVFHTNH